MRHLRYDLSDLDCKPWRNAVVCGPKNETRRDQFPSITRVSE